ncbi:hypothetical protein HanIR_Chr06g0293091 [Helianthus annuus]|nr:hypothetical protein HanIR_Chr06g0293091 [Helianthus annuus]
MKSCCCACTWKAAWIGTRLLVPSWTRHRSDQSVEDIAEQAHPWRTKSGFGVEGGQIDHLED